jgi:hypothetical protein
LRYYTRYSHVIWDTVDGVTRLCNTRTVEFFELNKTAALIWLMCEHKSQDELASILANAFPNQERASIEIDGENVLASFVQNGLLELTEQ